MALIATHSRQELDRFTVFDPFGHGQTELYLLRAIGDAAYGPAYYSGENGVAGYAELRFDQTLPNVWVKGYQLYSFIDRAAVWSYGVATPALSLSSADAVFASFFPTSFRPAWRLRPAPQWHDSERRQQRGISVHFVERVQALSG